MLSLELESESPLLPPPPPLIPCNPKAGTISPNRQVVECHAFQPFIYA